MANDDEFVDPGFTDQGYDSETGKISYDNDSSDDKSSSSSSSSSSTSKTRSSSSSLGSTKDDATTGSSAAADLSGETTEKTRTKDTEDTSTETKPDDTTQRDEPTTGGEGARAPERTTESPDPGTTERPKTAEDTFNREDQVKQQQGVETDATSRNLERARELEQQALEQSEAYNDPSEVRVVRDGDQLRVEPTEAGREARRQTRQDRLDQQIGETRREVAQRLSQDENVDVDPQNVRVEVDRPSTAAEAYRRQFGAGGQYRDRPSGSPIQLDVGLNALAMEEVLTGRAASQSDQYSEEDFQLQESDQPSQDFDVMLREEAARQQLATQFEQQTGRNVDPQDLELSRGPDGGFQAELPDQQDQQAESSGPDGYLAGVMEAAPQAAAGNPAGALAALGSSGAQSLAEGDYLESLGERSRDSLSPSVRMAVNEDTVADARRGERALEQRAEQGNLAARIYFGGEMLQRAGSDVGGVVEDVSQVEGVGPAVGGDESIGTQAERGVGALVGGPLFIGGQVAQGVVATGGLAGEVASEDSTAGEVGERTLETSVEATSSTANYFAQNPVEAGVMLAGPSAARRAPGAASRARQAAGRTRSRLSRDAVATDGGQPTFLNADPVTVARARGQRLATATRERASNLRQRADDSIVGELARDERGQGQLTGRQRSRSRSESSGESRSGEVSDAELARRGRRANYDTGNTRGRQLGRRSQGTGPLTVRAPGRGRAQGVRGQLEMIRQREAQKMPETDLRAQSDLQPGERLGAPDARPQPVEATWEETMADQAERAQQETQQRLEQAQQQEVTVDQGGVSGERTLERAGIDDGPAASVTQGPFARLQKAQRQQARVGEPDLPGVEELFGTGERAKTGSDAAQRTRERERTATQPTTGRPAERQSSGLFDDEVVGPRQDQPQRSGAAPVEREGTVPRENTTITTGQRDATTMSTDIGLDTPQLTTDIQTPRIGNPRRPPSRRRRIPRPDPDLPEGVGSGPGSVGSWLDAQIEYNPIERLGRGASPPLGQSRGRRESTWEETMADQADRAQREVATSRAGWSDSDEDDDDDWWELDAPRNEALDAMFGGGR